MPLSFGKHDHHLQQIAAKAAYVESTRKKLARSRAQLGDIRAAIRAATARAGVDAGDTLRRAQQAAEANLATAEARLAHLRKSGEADWSALQRGIDDSWEDLSHSIRDLVKRISDGD